MDRVTLTEKDITFITKFAAASILTGYFVANVLNATREEIEEAFTEPGDILVENMQNLYEQKTYSGYHFINEIREGQDSITVILSKEQALPPVTEEEPAEEEQEEEPDE